jgi:putative nucleotidyltransferase with HDIG domain
LEVMRELRSTEASVERVAAIVSKDLGISTKLVQLVNSPFYGLNQAVAEVQEAIAFLGLSTTINVVMSIEAFSRFDKIKPLYFSADRVWKHSQALGETARKICRVAGRDAEAAGQAYLAALLHDIGKLTLAENFADDYQTLTQTAEKQKRQVYELELETFGASHADAGAYLLAVWGLPISTVHAVSSHHAGFGTFNELTPATVVHLAEQMFGSPDPIEEIIQRYPPEVGLRDSLDQLRLIAPLRMKTGFGQAEGRQAGTAAAPTPVSPQASPRESTPSSGVSKVFGSLARLWS